MPLLERKERLEALLAGLPKKSPLHFSTHIRGRGATVFRKVCDSAEEGIVSKKVLAPYRGERSKTWLKVKCTRRQEFVIGGWTPSDKRSGFRSLLLGAFDGGKLDYVGRVGTGFDQNDLADLSKRFKAIARKTPPFENVPRDARRHAKWVEPKLVAEIEFTEFTGDGILRHPAFLGLREDKKPREVGLERPKPLEATMAKEGGDTVRAGVRITSPEKVLFADQGLSKGDLIDYYEAVADLILPHIKGRPLSLVRCPQGSSGKCFFQKHDSGGFPDELKRIEITEGTGASGQYFYIDDLKGLVAGVQMGVLEFHIWGSRAGKLEKPDRLVFDLDPDVGLDFKDVRRATIDVRDRLADLGLETFPMLSGGKGIHVVAPIDRRMEWPDVKAFCKGFAARLAEDAPDRYVVNMAKARRKGRIFLDYLRNERGSTAIAPYSTRARDGAPVATPITWDEVKKVDAANIFSVKTLSQRMKEAGDAWPGYFDVRQSITKAMLKAVN
jgi:bifunctional non-homologous end joining protein LigD